MTQKVAQGPRSFGVVSLLRPRDLWAKLPKAVLLVLLVMTGAFVQARELYVRNLTNYKIRASLDYILCKSDNAVVIDPGQMFTAKAEACLLSGIVIWMDDAGGAPKPKNQDQVVYRWHPGGNGSWGVWKVRLNADGVMEVNAKLLEVHRFRITKQQEHDDFWNYVRSNEF